MTVNMKQLLVELDREFQLGENWEQVSDDALSVLDESQPWFVRALVGFGAWIASILLLTFIFGLGMISDESAFIVIGIALIIGALLLRRFTESDFSDQMSLALSFAGQFAIAFGIAADSNEIKFFLWPLLIINSIMLFVFPSRTHRFLSVLFIVACIISLLYVYEQNALVCIVGPMLAVLLVIFADNEPAIVVRRWSSFLRPVMAAVMIAAFACLLLSTAYLLPQLKDEFTVYPRPWISSLILGAVLLYVTGRIWVGLFGSVSAPGSIAGFLLTVALIAAALPAPGLLLALIVIALGAAQGSRFYVGAGIMFLAVFITTYFYGIETSMLTKSMTLAATGLVIVFSRWLLLILRRREGDSGHA
ncbi:MAG: DUF4401 domain-containing protein [Gammaproteobacteria bacterium]|nr:DUF4401 domain-containing protein [Gammaproteobacteria bacterium]